MTNISTKENLPVLEKVITQESICKYAEASRDKNPIHINPAFATGTQFNGVIAHGMLTLAFVWEMLTQAFQQHWLETGHLKVRFEAPAYPGDRVRTWGEILKIQQTNDGQRVECAVGLKNNAEKTLIRGTANITIPVT